MFNYLRMVSMLSMALRKSPIFGYRAQILMSPVVHYFIGINYVPHIFYKYSSQGYESFSNSCLYKENYPLPTQLMSIWLQRMSAEKTTRTPQVGKYQIIQVSI